MGFTEYDILSHSCFYCALFDFLIFFFISNSLESHFIETFYYIRKENVMFTHIIHSSQYFSQHGEKGLFFREMVF